MVRNTRYCKDLENVLYLIRDIDITLKIVKNRKEPNMATKIELVAKIAEKTGFTKKDSGIFLENTFQAIAELLAEDGAVTLQGYGNFKVVDRAPRKGRNPQTQEVIDIPATKAVTFKAGKTLREAVK